jgi:hypothetical protein
VSLAGQPLVTRTTLAAATALLLLGLGRPAPAWAQARSWASLHLGAYDTADLADESGEIGLELRLAPAWRERLPHRLELRPMLGAAVTTDRARWIYAGLRADWRCAARWVVTPSFGVSLFAEGDGKDLGGPVEFRSALEAAYQAGDRLRLGLAFYHLSNASLYEHNPGSNSLVLTLATSLAER